MKVISNNEEGLRFMLCLNTIDDETCDDKRVVIANTDSEEDAGNKLADYMVNIGLEDGETISVFEWDGCRYVECAMWN